MEKGRIEGAQVARASTERLATADGIATYVADSGEGAQVILAVLRTLVWVGSGRMDESWRGGEGQRCSGSCAHLEAAFPTFPVGIVVFGCQIALPRCGREGEKNVPPIIRVDLEGGDFGR